MSLAKARAFEVQFYVDNKDRDPLGIDVFDTGFRFRYQLGDNTEVYADAIVDRVVALPETPAVPVSPRDLIFAGSPRVIPSVFVGEHPYLDHRGEASFDAFIPGTVTVGIARRLPTAYFESAIAAEVAIPLAGSLNALRSGANSGRPDVSIVGFMSRSLLGGQVDGRAGFTLAGKGSWPDRTISVVNGTATATETDPPTGNRVDLGLAWIRPFRDTFAAAIEARWRKELVGEERIDAISPVDVTLGVQKRFGRFRLTASLLQHFRSLPSGERRANPLAGAVDLSAVSLLDRNAYLARVGLLPAASFVRDGAHIVVIGASSSSLPAGAVRIEPTYEIRAEHNLGYVFSVSFRP